MTIILHLKPEVEAGLMAQARSRGMILEDYLLTLVEDVALPQSSEQGIVGFATRGRCGSSHD
jgi:hypothetical protein